MTSGLERKWDRKRKGRIGCDVSIWKHFNCFSWWSRSRFITLDFYILLLSFLPKPFPQHSHACLYKSSIDQLTGSPQSSCSWICKAETVSILTTHNEKMQVIHSCSHQQKLQPVARAMTSRRVFRPITHQAQGAWYLPMTDRYNEHRLNAWRQSDRTSTRSNIPVAPTHTTTRQPHCFFHFVTSIFLFFLFRAHTNVFIYIHNWVDASSSQNASVILCAFFIAFSHHFTSVLLRVNCCIVVLS